MPFFEEDDKTAYEAQQTAYWISFAPIIFQASRTLINTGILQTVKESRNEGLTMEDVIEKVGFSAYKVRVLLHAGLGIGLVYCKNDRYFITKTGIFMLNDRPVRINMDFTNDVCYNGLFYMEDSIKNGRPEGLKVFGDWNTIYEALAELPQHVQDSWFGLDHYYSDKAFPKAIPLILKTQDHPDILDIGGNTGKFARLLLQASNDVKVTILDLPGQIEMAKKNIAPHDKDGQVSFAPINLLDPWQKIPTGHNIIWMSQFLDCFSEEEIVSILRRCYDAIDENGCICILEGFWDKQTMDTAAFNLQLFSLYFTVMANGNSQMYDYGTFSKCVQAAGLRVAAEYHNISISNSLLICKRNS